MKRRGWEEGWDFEGHTRKDDAVDVCENLEQVWSCECVLVAEGRKKASVIRRLEGNCGSLCVKTSRNRKSVNVLWTLKLTRCVIT